jgi:hypothetical protein
MSAAVFFSELFAQAGQHRLVIDRIERLQPTLPERHRYVCVTESGDGSSTSRSFKKGIAASREVDFFGARMITETGVGGAKFMTSKERSDATSWKKYDGQWCVTNSLGLTTRTGTKGS